MKANYFKFDRFIPWLGIALVAGGIIAGATYLNFENKTRSAEACMATLDRLFQEQQLSMALRRIHDGEVAQAAQSLDLLLCGDILLTNAELPTADPATRVLVQDMFRKLAVVRPKTEGAAADPAREHIFDQFAAEKILTLALAAPRAAERK